MAAKKKNDTRVSSSKRGEDSKPKPAARRVSPSKRGEGVRSDKPTKVVESGVGNLPMAVAKLAMAISKQAPKAKPTIAKGQIKGTSSQRTSTQTSRARLKTTAKKTPDRPKTLYHGTATPKDLPKGTRLTRGSGATTNYKFAESYAKGRAEAVPSLAGRPRVLIVKNSKTSQHAKNRDGTVKWKSPKNEYKSPKGFVVKGEAKKPKVSKPKMKPGSEGPKRSVPRKKK